MSTTASTLFPALTNALTQIRTLYHNRQSELSAYLASKRALAKTTKNVWNTSLWACFVPFDLCLLTTFCPCITFGETQHRMQHDGDMSGYQCVNAHCLIYACLCACYGLHCFPQWMQLSQFRQRYNLEGNACTDCVKACCCAGCSVCQTEKETVIRVGKEKGQVDGVVEEQYRREGGMVYGAEARLEPIEEMGEEGMDGGEGEGRVGASEKGRV